VATESGEVTLTRWDKGTTHFKGSEPTRFARAAKKKADAEAAWIAVCKAVDARDGKACRCCDKRSDPDATGLLTRGHRHHIIYRSAGGPDESWNLVTLCARCHDAEHRGELRIDGPTMPLNADGPLLFLKPDADGVWCVTREEIAVRVVRKD
jgi:5-methylcytosine-specific restriction endonuclease McrA